MLFNYALINNKRGRNKFERVENLGDIIYAPLHIDDKLYSLGAIFSVNRFIKLPNLERSITIIGLILL